MLAGDFSAITVDDDPIFLDLLEAILGEIGIKKVVRADSGVNAYQALAALKSRIDFIFCDLKMPNGNGLQLLREVRLGRFKLVRPDACFIMVTAITHPLAIKTAAQLDVSGYVTKPISTEQLMDGIKKARAKAIKVDFGRYSSVTLPDTAAA
ncbi:MAG: response regulator [Rhodobacteraceae bacterium]|nr:response regulator [Paracoccaceae bacterium]